MSGFLSQIISQIFGRDEEPEALPDDGGLGDFMKQLSQEIELEEKTGRRPSVKAGDVLSVQQGRHGSRTYLIDSGDFRKAIVAELRESVAPVIEGILKTRCGEKGTGFMNVKALYVFHIHREDAVSEYNAAMDIVDDIGFRLLGDRYLKEDRQVNIPVAQVLPEDLFDLSGKFNLKKAKKSLKWVRDTHTHGPAGVDWEKGEAKIAEGAPDRVAEERPEKESIDGDWEKQQHETTPEDRGDWEEIKVKRKPQKQWESLKPKPALKKVGPAKPAAKKTETIATERAWGDLTPQPPSPPKKAKPKLKRARPKPVAAKPVRVHSSNLEELGVISLGFRPTWQASQEKIATFVAYPYRKFDESILEGESIYPKDGNPVSILKIDQAIAKQTAKHLLRTRKVEEKTIVLPLHLKSLLVEHELSPLRDLRELDPVRRKSIWIEIIGIEETASASEIKAAVTNHRDKFMTFGVRFKTETANRSLIEQTKVDFLSCDFNTSPQASRQSLPGFLAMAKTNNLESCTWGIHNQDDLHIALQEGSAFINGQALAKELRRPGRIVSMPADTLVS